jgi:hypothetical protein
MKNISKISSEKLSLPTRQQLNQIFCLINPQIERREPNKISYSDTAHVFYFGQTARSFSEAHEVSIPCDCITQNIVAIQPLHVVH